MMKLLSTVKPLSITLLAVFIAALLKIAVLQGLGVQSPYLIFFSAIAVAAVAGGFFQGMIAVFLSAFVIDAIFQSLNIASIILFLADGLLVSAIGGFTSPFICWESPRTSRS